MFQKITKQATEKVKPRIEKYQKIIESYGYK